MTVFLEDIIATLDTGEGLLIDLDKAALNRENIERMRKLENDNTQNHFEGIDGKFSKRLKK